MSFVKRFDAAPVCYSKPFNSVKNWNDHFFLVDSTVFPLFMSLKGKILDKDPPPRLSQYDTQTYDFLRGHTAPFQKNSEPFLCWVGISCYYTLDKNCYLTFWDGNKEMDLLVFIRHSNPTKGSSDSIDKLFDEGDDAKQGHSIERDDHVPEETISKDVPEVAAEKAKKQQRRKAIEDASGSALPPNKLREDYHDVTPNIGGKSPAAIRGLMLEGSNVPSGVTEPLVVASVTPTLELSLRTRPLDVRYVISSNDFHHLSSSSEVNSFARSPAADALVVTVAVTTTVAANVSVVLIPRVRVESKNLANIREFALSCGANADAASVSKLNKPSTSSDSFYASQTLDAETMYHIYMPKWTVTNDSILEDPYTEFNVGAARQVCLGAEVRMRAEHTLEKKEAEATEAIRLPGQLSIVEAADVIKGNELKDLKEKNLALEEEKNVLSRKVLTLESVAAVKETELASLSAQVVKLTSYLSGFQLLHDELSSKRSSLESAFEIFKEQMKAMQDEQATALGNRVAELDAQLLEMADHLEK
ncbi:hypothetical protein Tco_0996817 [Tanacetum coccineum]